MPNDTIWQHWTTSTEKSEWSLPLASWTKSNVEISVRKTFITCLLRDIKATPPLRFNPFLGKARWVSHFYISAVIDRMGQIRRAEMKGEKTERQLRNGRNAFSLYEIFFFNNPISQTASRENQILFSFPLGNGKKWETETISPPGLKFFPFWGNDKDGDDISWYFLSTEKSLLHFSHLMKMFPPKAAAFSSSSFLAINFFFASVICQIPSTYLPLLGHPSRSSVAREGNVIPPRTVALEMRKKRENENPGSWSKFVAATMLVSLIVRIFLKKLSFLTSGLETRKMQISNACVTPSLYPPDSSISSFLSRLRFASASAPTVARPNGRRGRGALLKPPFHTQLAKVASKKNGGNKYRTVIWSYIQWGRQGRMPTWTTERSFQDRGATFFLNHDGFSPLKRQRERERDSNKPRRKREGRGEEKLVLSLVYSETSKENARVTKAKILVWLSCTAEKDLPVQAHFIWEAKNLWCWISRAGELRRRTQRKNITQSRNRGQFSLLRVTILWRLRQREEKGEIP